MTEQEPQSGPEESESASPTGVPAVDAALAEVDDVDALPLAEQLAAFGRAHDRLRSALDSEPGDPA